MDIQALLGLVKKQQDQEVPESIARPSDENMITSNPEAVKKFIQMYKGSVDKNGVVVSPEQQLANVSPNKNADSPSFADVESKAKEDEGNNVEDLKSISQESDDQPDVENQKSQYAAIDASDVWNRNKDKTLNPDMESTEPQAPAAQSQQDLINSYLKTKQDSSQNPQDLVAMLKQAQENENQKQLVHGLAQAATMLGQSIAHQKQDTSALDKIGTGENQVTALQKQIQMGQEQSNIDMAQKQRDPNSALSIQGRELLKKVGINVPDNFSAADAEKLGLNYSNLLTQKSAQDLKKELAYEMMGSKESIAESKNAAGGANSQSKAYEKAVSQAEVVRGDKAVQQAKADMYAIKKINSLVNLNGDPNNLDQQQVELLAAEIGKVATGGVPTIHELTVLNPGSISKSLREAATKVTNTPTPANRGEFVMAMKKYADSINHDAQSTIKDKYQRALSAFESKMGTDNAANFKKTFIDSLDSSEAPKAPVNKPQTVIQNGHTYNLNPLTGDYE